MSPRHKADKPGRNLAHQWVEANGFGIYWKVLNEKARAALCAALAAPSVEKARRDVEDARRTLASAEAALKVAETRDDVLAATLKELRALYALVHGSTSSRRTIIDPEPEAPRA